MADELMEVEHTVFLQTTGKFFNKNAQEGIVSTIWNFPVRGHLWKIQRLAFDARTGDFATVDEKGQIYWYSMKQNVYSLVKKAAAPIVALDFAPANARQLIISYENGAILLLDIDSKAIVSNIPHLTSMANVAPVLVCSHMKTAVSAIAYDDVITLWNMKTMSCMSSLELSQPMIGMEFIDASGGWQYIIIVSAACVTGSKSIASIYNCKTYEVVTSCCCPSSERLPTHFTAYCSLEHVAKKVSIYRENHALSDSAHAGNSSLVHRYAVIAGSNGLLYVWSVHLQQSETDERGASKAAYLGAVELPVKMSYAVAMHQIGDTDCSPRIGVLSVEGHFIIVDIEGICHGTVGYWTVVSDVSSKRIIGTPIDESVKWDTHKAPLVHNTAQSASKSNEKRNRVSQKMALTKSNPCEPFIGTCNSLFVAHKEYLWVVGIDGAVRIFNTAVLVGESSVGEEVDSSSAKFLLGKPLRVRERLRDDDDENEGGHDCAVNPGIKQFQLLSGPHVALEEQRIASLEAAKKRKKTLEARKAKLAKVQRAQQTGERSSDGDTVEDWDASGIEATGIEKSPQQKSNAQEIAEEEAKLPLFELAHIMPRDREMNETKLKVFLNRNGHYPERYRPLIWRFLLRLPENSAIFTDLARRGTHAAYEELHSKYPLQNSRMFTRLQAICSMLTHWSPIFADVSYIPVITFPFLLVFTRDDLAVLETMITILMWWGYSWQVTFPNPPVHIVNAIDALVQLHDPKLYQHMIGLLSNSSNATVNSITAGSGVKAKGTIEFGGDHNSKNKAVALSPGLVGWVLMSTLFTEILSKEAWLQLFDHIFTHGRDKAVLMLLAPVAIMRITRASVLQTVNYKAASLFYRRQQHVEIHQVLQSMYSMLKNTPPKFLVGLHCVSVENLNVPQRKSNARSSDKDGFLGVNSVQETIRDISTSEGNPVFPLPRSSSNYPAYDGFPKTIVDYQLLNREKTMELHNETVERKKILRQLELKIAQVETEHQKWIAKHKSISQTELDHRERMMAKEKAHLLELRNIEESISEQRIKSLTVMESVAKEELELLDKIGQDTKKLMAQGEIHLNEKMDIAMNVQKHRELAIQAEQATMQQMRRLQLHRTREDWVHGLDDVFKSKEEEIEAKNAVLSEEWRVQDEEAKLREAQREERLRLEAQQDKYASLQEDMSARLQKLYLARQAKIMEVERSRAMRLAKEQADEAVEVANRSALLLQKQELAATVEEDALFSEKAVKVSQQRLMGTIDMIRDEGDKLIEAERVYAVKQQQARQKARVAQLRKEWAEKQGQQLQKTIEAERYAQEQVIRMKKAAARVAAEVQQPLPTSLTGKTSSKGVRNGSDRNGPGYVAADVREYYEGAESRLEDLAESLLIEQRKKYEEIANSSTPFRANELDAVSESTGTNVRRSPKPSDRRSPKPPKPSSPTKSRGATSEVTSTTKRGHHIVRTLDDLSSSSGSDEEVMAVSRRNPDIILSNNSDEYSDESEAGPDSSTSHAQSPSGVHHKSGRGKLSKIAESAASFLEGYEKSSTPHKKSNGATVQDTRKTEHAKSHSNNKTSVRTNSNSTKRTSHTSSSLHALEEIADQSIQSLHELKLEMKREEQQDQNQLNYDRHSEDSIHYSHTSDSNSGNRSGVSGDSALWEFHDSEESEEGGGL